MSRRMFMVSDAGVIADEIAGYVLANEMDLDRFLAEIAEQARQIVREMTEGEVA